MSEIDFRYVYTEDMAIGSSKNCVTLDVALPPENNGFLECARQAYPGHLLNANTTQAVDNLIACWSGGALVSEESDSLVKKGFPTIVGHGNEGSFVTGGGNHPQQVMKFSALGTNPLGKLT